ncbi:MAG: 50S ribosomal protein L15 [Candidatus Liptonbacteria bacterium GWC1_60_9]|uniref:Large ribosomal subunit protein uL15 n=2 Tax=Candidatus Liptoniibacteriota TaxID=1817909 RepID=A0A1G2CNP3_9BACT|nr:MAG: 50S ribosomal protein L15 [Parcubacteria group bacterium GW2011_GWA1_60_11]OGY97288.1 MAG: 50S ribosomal protein L15 [Candidatus Liptonbacteria bacterium GWC1_60_9]OGZ02261.1 MAG: 50S ribosomal protein L15 [Candidatus Liptonbacteria bacterium RIFCSPLOWO2_12_FULL_60_15]
MQLHTLIPNHPSKAKKRIARGGKRGTYSGRGIKGQKSRSGHRIRPAERDLIIRLPKLRGFKNKSLVLKPLVVNVGDLVALGLVDITRETLIEKGVLRRRRDSVKILGGGELSKPVHVKGISVSKSAKMKIEKAGGSVA